jgi:hypothetical protein
MNRELKLLERKHGRAFPSLWQAIDFDRNNPSLRKLKELKAMCKTQNPKRST